MSQVILGPDPLFRRALVAVRRAPATSLFLAACVALFVVAEQHGSTEDVATLVRFGATERGHVWAGEVWRLVTAAFLHIGVLHLVWNVVMMLGWCTPVERALGTARFAAVYLGAAIAGSATSLLVHDVIGAGASGAGFGIIGASLTIDARRLGSWRAFAADRRVRRIAVLVIVWTVGLAGMNVDHAAHLGGLVGGIALTWALTAPGDASPASRRWAWSVAAVAVIVPAALAVVPRSGPTNYEMTATRSEFARALRDGDLDAAERALARARNPGHSSTWLEYGRALLRERRGDLDGAARDYEAMAQSTDPDTRRVGVNAAKILLAKRLANGLGMTSDPERSRKLLEEVCSSGDDRICRWLAENPRPSPGKR
jgi:membrane associated rhomboid family serine protease